MQSLGVFQDRSVQHLILCCVVQLPARVKQDTEDVYVLPALAGRPVDQSLARFNLSITQGVRGVHSSGEYNPYFCVPPSHSALAEVKYGAQLPLTCSLGHNSPAE